MSMPSRNSERAALIERFKDKPRRHHFAALFIKQGLAEQIHEMRIARGWTQSDLAQQSGKVQETISQLENPNYGSYTIKTLQRLADAFDVALFVRFGPFSELVDRVVQLSPDDLAVPSFEEDTALVSTPVMLPGPSSTRMSRSGNRASGSNGSGELVLSGSGMGSSLGNRTVPISRQHTYRRDERSVKVG